MGFMRISNYVYLVDGNFLKKQEEVKSFSEKKENIIILKKIGVNNILAHSATNATSYVKEFDNSMGGYY